MDKLIVLFKEKIIFKQFIPKKHKYFDVEIYKLCDKTYDMNIFLGKG